MAKYRDAFYRIDTPFLTDGGLETTLVFLRGVDLPHFAAFPLIDHPDGRRELLNYYKPYLKLAIEGEIGFILDAPTWRANPDWAQRLGYSLTDLRRVHTDAVAFLQQLRTNWETERSKCIINGVIGPRGDGYKDGNMDVAAAQDYHQWQIATFTETGADIVSAITMNNTGEAIGIARAAACHQMPCVVSFTVETDGKLVNGTSLQAAVEETDDATNGSVAYYMVNCAHPSHFDGALKQGEPWTARIQGLRANASTRSHAELDESTELDIGDVDDLARRYRNLKRNFPNLRILGGCCGTDHRHLTAICEACW